MGKSIIMHIDEAPWVEGMPSKRYRTQFIGDQEKGPWVYISSPEPDKLIPAHSHDQDEVIFIVEGELTIGDGTHGPGTVIFIERNTEYSFTTGKKGLKFLNIRPGKAGIKWAGKETYFVPDEAPSR